MPIPWNQVSYRDRMFASGAGNPNVTPQQQQQNIAGMGNGTFNFQNTLRGGPMGQVLPQQQPPANEGAYSAGSMGNPLMRNLMQRPATPAPTQSFQQPMPSFGGQMQGTPGYGGVGQQQTQTYGAPPLRVSSPNAQPGMAQHLSDLLSQRNQQTALDLTRQGAYANATHGLQAQQARSRAGLGWAGIQSSDQLAGMQNQMDVINAIIRMLGNPFADLGL